MSTETVVTIYCDGDQIRSCHLTVKDGPSYKVVVRTALALGWRIVNKDEAYCPNCRA